MLLFWGRGGAGGGGVSDLVWSVRRGGEGGGGGLVRQRIMKVAKDWERFPIAMLERESFLLFVG